MENFKKLGLLEKRKLAIRAFTKLNEDTTKYIYFDHLENIIIKMVKN